MLADKGNSYFICRGGIAERGWGYSDNSCVPKMDFLNQSFLHKQQLPERKLRLFW